MTRVMGYGPKKISHYGSLLDSPEETLVIWLPVLRAVKGFRFNNIKTQVSKRN